MRSIVIYYLLYIPGNLHYSDRKQVESWLYNNCLFDTFLCWSPSSCHLSVKDAQKKGWPNWSPLLNDKFNQGLGNSKYIQVNLLSLSYPRGGGEGAQRPPIAFLFIDIECMHRLGKSRKHASSAYGQLMKKNFGLSWKKQVCVTILFCQ